MHVLKTALAVLGMLALSSGPLPDRVQWQSLQPGVELAVIGAHDPLYVVRIDPTHAQLQAALASESGEKRTAAEWCRGKKLSVAINLGMFQGDQRSNVGYLRNSQHVNNGRWNAYRSVLAVNPKDAGRQPLLVWRDLDQNNATADLSGY